MSVEMTLTSKLSLVEDGPGSMRARCAWMLEMEGMTEVYICRCLEEEMRLAEARGDVPACDRLALALTEAGEQLQLTIDLDAQKAAQTAAGGPASSTSKAYPDGGNCLLWKAVGSMQSVYHSLRDKIYSYARMDTSQDMEDGDHNA